MKKKKILTEELNDIEKEIIPYLVQGFTCKEIGEIVYMSHHTVKHYIGSIIKKTQAKNRINAVAILVRAKYA